MPLSSIKKVRGITYWEFPIGTGESTKLRCKIKPQLASSRMKLIKAAKFRVGLTTTCTGAAAAQFTWLVVRSFGGPVMSSVRSPCVTMKNVFVSSERIDEPCCQALIQALQNAGFVVSHSPRNPLDGGDPRWKDWYVKNLDIELNKAQVVIMVITKGWDCSTWMATEAQRAKELYEKKKIEKYFYWNPYRIETNAAGMQAFHLEELPAELDQLITKLT